MSEPIVKLLDYQKRAVESTARFTWHNWSRQIGKSFTLSLRRLLRTLETGRLQVILSAGERQSREVMDKVRMHCSALKAASEFHENTFFEGTSIKQLELRLPNRGRIIALPANPQTARGFTGDVFLDEFAMHQDDRAIWGALFPTVMRADGQLDIASTPKGKKNMFYKLATNERFDRSTVTIEDAICGGLEVDLAAVREGIDDDEIYRQEFMCEFIDESTAFLTFEQIAGCEDHECPLPVRLDGKDTDYRLRLAALIGHLNTLGQLDGPLFVGFDIARGGRDLSVMWIVQKTGDELRTVAVIEMNNVSFRDQVAILDTIEAASNVRRTGIDATGLGMQLAEQAQQRWSEFKIDAVTFTQQVKAELAGRLRVKVDDQSIRIPVSDRIRNDWHSIERITTVSGNIMYRADRTRNGHADRFWAAALAVSAAHDATVAWDGTLTRDKRTAPRFAGPRFGSQGGRRELVKV